MTNPRKTVRAKIISVLDAYQPLNMTCDEMCEFERWQHQSISAEVRRMVQAGLLRLARHKNGDLVRRKTRLGRMAQAWRLATKRELAGRA